MILFCLPATLLLILLLFCRGSLLPYSVPSFPPLVSYTQPLFCLSTFSRITSSLQVKVHPEHPPSNSFSLRPFCIPRSSLFVQIRGVIQQASAPSPVPNPVFYLLSSMLYPEVLPLVPVLVQCFCPCNAWMLEQCITI